MEALKKFSDEAKEASYEEALNLALPRFKDRLDQIFIVPKDSKPFEPKRQDVLVTGSNQVPTGTQLLEIQRLELIPNVRLIKFSLC